jgi:hypothetical protein
MTMPGPIIGKWLMLFGCVVITLGALFYFGLLPGKLGQLPGDINIRREGYSVHIPIVTLLIISIVLTIILNLIFRIRR